MNAFSPFCPLAALTTAASLFLLTGCGGSKNKDDAKTASADADTPRVTGSRDVEFPRASPQLGAVRTALVTPAPPQRQRLTGRLVWDEDHTLRVFAPVSGRVEKIVAEIGQTVKKGDDLAFLRSPDLGQAEADYRKAESDLIQSQKSLARVRALQSHGAAAQKEVEGAQSDFEHAQAEKQRAEARLALLGTIGGDFSDLFHVRSPLDGVVVDRHLTVGQEIRSDIQLAGTPDLIAPLFTVTDPAHLWVLLDVPESALDRLHPGLSVELKTPAFPGRAFPGKLTLVSAALDPQTRVARARAEVDNADGLLKAEMYVSVDADLGARGEGANANNRGGGDHSVEVPARAVCYLEGKYFVFLETAPGKFSRREVTPERETPAAVVVRGAGLAPGQRVVTEGGLLLNELLADAAGENNDEPAPASQSPPPPLDGADRAGG